MLNKKILLPDHEIQTSSVEHIIDEDTTSELRKEKKPCLRKRLRAYFKRSSGKEGKEPGTKRRFFRRKAVKAHKPTTVVEEEEE